MARVVVSGIVEFPPEVRDEALVKGKALIDGAYTEKGCIHFGLLTSTTPAASLCMKNGRAVLTSKPTCRASGTEICSAT